MGLPRLEHACTLQQEPSLGFRPASGNLRPHSLHSPRPQPLHFPSLWLTAVYPDLNFLIPADQALDDWAALLRNLLRMEHGSLAEGGQGANPPTNCLSHSSSRGSRSNADEAIRLSPGTGCSQLHGGGPPGVSPTPCPHFLNSSSHNPDILTTRTRQVQQETDLPTATGRMVNFT